MTTTPDAPIDLVAFSGNAHRPSRSRALTELISNRIGQQVRARIRQFDIVDANPGLGAALSREQLSPDALAIVEAVENADMLVVSSPVYKGSYTGLFKHFFDFVDPTALIGKPVVIAATGGGPRHSLVVEHQLRPLFGFFSALTIPTSIYAEDKSFEDFRQVVDGGGDHQPAASLADLDAAAVAKAGEPLGHLLAFLDERIVGDLAVVGDRPGGA